MLRVRHLAVPPILAALTVAGSNGSAATTPGFSLSVSTPALTNNAIVAVTVRCPKSQSKCSGATLAYVPAEPRAKVAALRQGLLIAPAQPFTLTRGQSTTLRLLIPLSEIAAFRQASSVLLQTYTLAGNPNTKRTTQVFRTGFASIAGHDRRLFGLHRLRLRLVGLQLKRKQDRLLLTVKCAGASPKAKSSVFGGCEGLIDVFGGTLNATPPRLSIVGGTAYFLHTETTFRASVPLLKRQLAKVGHEPNPYLAVYSIASDRVDMLGAAQLVRLPFAHK